MAEKTEKKPLSDTSEKKATAPKPPTKKAKKGGFFIFITFLFAIGALGLSAYIAQQGLLLRTEVSKLTTELSQLRLLDQQPIIQDLMQEINTQNIEQKNLQEAINQRFKDWQITLEKKQSITERKKDDWVLNEVVYLMRMASTRLHLASDINSSIAALTQADLRLNELENPRYLPIRKALANEISELQALRNPDVDGTALKIEQIMNNLPTLPDTIVSQKEPVAETPVEEASETVNEQAQNLLFKLLTMFGFKQNAGKAPTLAKRDNLLFLDQLIKLELESAKQALIRFKGEDFNNHIKRARGLIKKHYKKNNADVIKVLGQLDNIIDNNIFPELPDITRSLNLLQSTINRYKTPEDSKENKKPSDESKEPATETKAEQTV